MAANIIQINTTVSTGTHTIPVTMLGPSIWPVRHQVVCQAFESSSTGTALNPTSGVVTINYMPMNSTAYIAMTETVDLSSGAVAKIFTGAYTNLQLTHTMGSSAPFTVHYVGWTE